MKSFVKLPKLSKGDQVAIVSPSAGLPGLFPWVQELGLERLDKTFGLKPKEYPTTRMMGSALQDRADDLMAAFADTNNKAVFTSIGGSDQIKLIKYLDPQVFIDNPKPFFGFSDNTHIHNFLWGLGIPSFYGGAVMCQLAMQPTMHSLTMNSINHALFDSGEYEAEVSQEYTDEGLGWADKSNLSKDRKMNKNAGLIWDNPADVSGILWGGCVESLIAQSTVGKFLPKDEELDGTVLFIETSEDIPDPWILEYLLIGYGERGWFDKFQAVLVGRPKAWEFSNRKSDSEKIAYTKEQQQTVLSVVREYNKNIPIVQNVDFGHTDPQLMLPMGNEARLSSVDQKIFLTY